MPKAASLFLIRHGTQFAARNVRYWHLADIGECTAHVCFWGQSGHALVLTNVSFRWQRRHRLCARTRIISGSPVYSDKNGSF